MLKLMLGAADNAGHCLDGHLYQECRSPLSSCSYAHLAAGRCIWCFGVSGVTHWGRWNSPPGRQPGVLHFHLAVQLLSRSPSGCYLAGRVPDQQVSTQNTGVGRVHPSVELDALRLSEQNVVIHTKSLFLSFEEKNLDRKWKEENQVVSSMMDISENTDMTPTQVQTHMDFIFPHSDKWKLTPRHQAFFFFIPITLKRIKLASNIRRERCHVWCDNDSTGGVCITVIVLGVSRYPKNNTSSSPAGPWVLNQSRGKIWVQAGNGDVSDCNGEWRWVTAMWARATASDGERRWATMREAQLCANERVAKRISGDLTEIFSGAL